MASPSYAPYTNDSANAIYNLLFCDDSSKFQPKPGENPASWQIALFATPRTSPALEALASDSSQEGRIRYLAFSRLRELGKLVSS